MKNIDNLIELANDVSYLKTLNNAIITVDHNCRNWHVFIGGKMYEIRNDELTNSHINFITKIINSQIYPPDKIYIVNGDQFGSIQRALMRELPFNTETIVPYMGEI